MMPDQIHALVAKCLTEPDLLRRLSERDVCDISSGWSAIEEMAYSALQREQIDRLRKFGAFITKVKHNGLRRTLPHTMALLSEFGLELAFFEYFAPEFAAARQGGPLSLDRHLDVFVPALRNFLQRAATQGAALVGDMLDHETTLYSVAVGMGTLRNGVVFWNGASQIARHSHDLLSVATLLCERRFLASGDVSRRDTYLFYQATPPRGPILLREVDAFSALVLRELDQATSLAAVASGLSCQLTWPVSEADVAFAVNEAQKAGLLTVQGAAFS